MSTNRINCALFLIIKVWIKPIQIKWLVKQNKNYRNSIINVTWTCVCVAQALPALSLSLALALSRSVTRFYITWSNIYADDSENKQALKYHKLRITLSKAIIVFCVTQEYENIRNTLKHNHTINVFCLKDKWTVFILVFTNSLQRNSIEYERN